MFMARMIAFPRFRTIYVYLGSLARVCVAKEVAYFPAGQLMAWRVMERAFETSAVTGRKKESSVYF